VYVPTDIRPDLLPVDTSKTNKLKCEDNITAEARAPLRLVILKTRHGQRQSQNQAGTFRLEVVSARRSQRGSNLCSTPL
jgi:hypothetical protein